MNKIMIMFPSSTSVVAYAQLNQFNLANVNLHFAISKWLVNIYDSFYLYTSVLIRQLIGSSRMAARFVCTVTRDSKTYISAITRRTSIFRARRQTRYLF